MIYLDNNATTSIADEVFEAMQPFLTEHFGNPSSSHSMSEAPRKAIETARSEIARLIGARHASEIVITSGGTESDNWAIAGSLRAKPEKDHIITTRVEHEAVRKQCEALERNGFRISWLDVYENGALDLDQLRSELSSDTAVVSVMLANNETGVIFPIAEIARILRENSTAIFHVDAVNAVGKIPIETEMWNVDLLSLSSHKFHGPKGIGALYIRDGLNLPSIFNGGGQERGRRAGTEAVHQIAGIGRAAKLASDLTAMNAVSAMRDRLENEILDRIPNTFVNGSRNVLERLPNTSNISFANSNGELLMHFLDEAGICVSTGSACNSTTKRSSPVLEAMNIPYSNAMGSIRFSLGRMNKEEEIDQVIDVLPSLVEKARAFVG